MNGNFSLFCAKTREKKDFPSENRSPPDERTNKRKPPSAPPPLFPRILCFFTRNYVYSTNNNLRNRLALPTLELLKNIYIILVLPFVQFPSTRTFLCAFPSVTSDRNQREARGRQTKALLFSPSFPTNLLPPVKTEGEGQRKKEWRRISQASKDREKRFAEQFFFPLQKR